MWVWENANGSEILIQHLSFTLMAIASGVRSLCCEECA